jgi:hypothetical protein
MMCMRQLPSLPFTIPSRHPLIRFIRSGEGAITSPG